MAKWKRVCSIKPPAGPIQVTIDAKCDWTLEQVDGTKKFHGGAGRWQFRVGKEGETQCCNKIDVEDTSTQQPRLTKKP